MTDLREETLDQMQTRLIAESYGIPLAEVQENFNRGMCPEHDWTPEFRAKIEAGIRSAGRRNGRSTHEIELALDLILGPH